MLHHLNLACGGSLGFYDLPDESYLTARTASGLAASGGFQNSAFAEL
jgi:hypothetical protein